MTYGRRREVVLDAELEQLLDQFDVAADAAEFEALIAYRPHPEIIGVCKRATRVASNLRARLQDARGSARDEIRRKGAKWLRDTSNAYFGRLDRYDPRDLDRLVGCLTRVESVIKMTPDDLKRLRAAIASRLGIPNGEAHYEDAIDTELGGAIYGCTPCIFGRKLCHKNIVPDDGSCSYLAWDNWICRC